METPTIEERLSLGITMAERLVRDPALAHIIKEARAVIREQRQEIDELEFAVKNLRGIVYR